MNEDFNIENELVPPKPKVDKPEFNKKEAINRSLLSMGLFIAIFYFFLGLELRMILIVVAALIIHELGHFFVMEKYGYKDMKIFFVPLLGAYVSGENNEVTQKQKALIYLAGPLPGLLLGLIFVAAWVHTDVDNFILLASVFIYLNAFNLLPVTPLDGGKFLESLFFSSNEIIQLVFLGLSVLAIIAISILFNFYILLFFGVLLAGKFYSQFETYRLRKILQQKNVNLNQTYEEISDHEYWSIRDEVIKKFSYFRKIPKGVYMYNEREPLIINHIKMIIFKKPYNDLSSTAKFALFFIWLIFLLSPIGLYFLSMHYDIFSDKKA